VAEHEGLVIVMSAPSGAGKQALLSALREQEPNLVSTVSATTRAPRAGEADGRDYYFLDEETFMQKVADKAFVEWAEVHGKHYGTLHEELDRCIASGRDVVLELDVQGMRSLREQRRDVVSVFLMPPSLEELKKRLLKRNANDEDDMAVRLRNAEEEMAARNEFDYVVVNEVLEKAAEEMTAIIRGERARRASLLQE
jgi:guanylate kinase